MHLMKSLYTSAVVLAAIALIGSIGATLEQNQASAQGVIVNYKEQFTKLTDEFEKAVLDEAAADPPSPDRIQKLLDEYNRNFMMVFGLEPPDPDAQPPDPDAESPDQSLKEPGKLEPPS